MRRNFLFAWAALAGIVPSVLACNQGCRDAVAVYDWTVAATSVSPATAPDAGADSGARVAAGSEAAARFSEQPCRVTCAALMVANVLKVDDDAGDEAAFQETQVSSCLPPAPGDGGLEVHCEYRARACNDDLAPTRRAADKVPLPKIP